MIKVIKKIFNLFFHEVGLINGNLNYLINRIIHNKSHINLKEIKDNNYEIIDKSKFNEFGWSKIYLSKSIKNKTHELLSELKKNDSSSSKNHWKELFANEIKIKNFIADELLKTRIFDFAFEYFNSIPLLRNINLYYTEGKKNMDFSSSMNWHKDLNHKELIKIMYFISDVKDENGPTNFFNKKDSKYIRYNNFPNYFSDAELAAQKITFNQQKCLGNSGESFMLDTAKCFHMGSRSKKDRLQIIITISPYASKLYPFKSVHVDKHLKDFNRSLYESFKVI